MSELANYSIETDHIVLLAFRDGRRLRVPVGQLAHHLSPPDLEKVRAALKLRRDFIRRHMPKVVLALAAAGGLIAALAVGGHAVAGLWQKSHPVNPSPTNTGLVRSESLPHPAPTPSMQTTTVAANSAAAATTSAGTSTNTTISRTTLVTHQSSPQINQTVSKTVKNVPVSASLPSPTPSPTPAQTPGPQVAQNPPPPSPVPTPPSGSVLGCATDTDPSCGSTAPSAK
jgi:cytoskeletal protein RodZ